MNIIYTLVGKRPDTVLVGYSEYQGNFEQISSQILRKITNNPRDSLTYNNQYNFYYINKDKIVFLCMTDSSFPSQFAFELLDDIMNEFYSMFNANEIENAIAYSLEKSFRDKLRIKVAHHTKSLNKANESINKLKESLINTKTQVLESTDSLNERFENLNIVATKAEKLSIDGSNFLASSQKLKRTVKLRRLKMFAIIIFIVILLSILLYVLFR